MDLGTHQRFETDGLQGRSLQGEEDPYSPYAPGLGSAAERAMQSPINLTGIWRAAGTAPGAPELSHSMFVLQRNGVLNGADTDARGYLSGKVQATAAGDVTVVGNFVREDGRKGGFSWRILHGGRSIEGTWQTTDGKTGVWKAVKQGNKLDGALVSFLSKRNWMGPGGKVAASADAPGPLPPSMAPGLGGVKYCYKTIPATPFTSAKQVKYACGYEQDIPGGGTVSVGTEEGVQVDVPTPGGETAPLPAAPPEDETVAKTRKVMYALLGVAGGAVLIGGYLLMRR